MKFEVLNYVETVPNEVGLLTAVELAADPADPLLTMPVGMPLTNRLDKLTREQANWAIENGDAWIAYLKEQCDAGVDVDLLEHIPRAKTAVPTDAETYKTICDVVEKVWVGLTEDIERKILETEQAPEYFMAIVAGVKVKRLYLEPDKVSGWVNTLQWAIMALPVEYKRQRDIFIDELKAYSKPKTKTRKKNK